MATATNAYIIVDKSRYEIFIGSNSTVEREQDYDRESKKRTDKVHKATGLPVWSVDAEIVDLDTKEVVGAKVKILANSQPELKPRSVAYVDGDLRVFAWADQRGNGKQSWNVLGTLTNDKPASPKANNFGGDAK